MKNALKTLSFDLPVMLKSKMLTVKSQKGATMIEYALIAGLISVAVIGTVTTIGDELVAVFGKIIAELAKAK
ncbi:Flp family type IVb pilin [Chlorobium phaeovibrioides]|uniref:Flp family type IVb pilin n=1 Tax=Chlorobium phaeovibrioides TaxID=1094 RepID=A0A5M8IAY5_CHLPH|nr:Flp family type IVb pilin [Chlorobium phaeovibrioides]KAA6232217.1 Flp family type IVb pilin [Chlorobium phaeovibrioides]